MLDVEGQIQRHQPEAIAQRPLVVRGAHVDRHQRPDVDVGLVALLQQVVAKGAGGGGDQQIVDRAAEYPPHCLHVRQRDLF